MMDIPAVDAVGVLAQRRHSRVLLGIAVGHEYEMPGTGQQAVVRCDRQFAGQGLGITVYGHKLIAVATVDQCGYLHPGQRMAPEQQAQRRHQHDRPHSRVGLGRQFAAVGNQYAVGLAGVCVMRTLQAVLTQTLQVGACARQDQRGFSAGRVADHTHLAVIQIRPDHCIITRCGDRRADLQRPSIKIAQGAKATVVAHVVPRVHHRHHHEPLPRQRRGQVMQGQWAARIAVRQYQQRESPHGDGRLFGHVDGIPVYTADTGFANGRVERQGLHRAAIDRVGQGHKVQAGNPRRGLGAGQQAAEQDQRQHAACKGHRPAVPCRTKG